MFGMTPDHVLRDGTKLEMMVVSNRKNDFTFIRSAKRGGKRAFRKTRRERARKWANQCCGIQSFEIHDNM